MAKWSHLESSAPMLLTISLAGVGFCGADVGGFFFDPDAELLTRWYQAGIWYPFFRAHAHIDTKRREPWLFGEPYTTLIRNAIVTRYQFLPYWYTLFRTGQMEAVVPMRYVLFRWLAAAHSWFTSLPFVMKCIGRYSLSFQRRNKSSRRKISTWWDLP